jgi:pyridoxal biosynthesis lyase PdxS
MLKGGVIMDVVTPEEARIAEEAGAVAVMALERVPADIRRQGGVARMSDPQVYDIAYLLRYTLQTTPRINSHSSFRFCR